MYKIVKDISKAMKDKAERLKIEAEKLLRKNEDIKPGSYILRVWGNFSLSAEPRLVIETNNNPQVAVDIVVSAKGYRFVVFTRNKADQSHIDTILSENNFEFKKWQDFLEDEKATNRALITKIPSTIIGNLFCDPESESESKSEPDYVFRLNYDNEKDTKINKEEETIQVAKIGVKIYEKICKVYSND